MQLLRDIPHSQVVSITKALGHTFHGKSEMAIRTTTGQMMLLVGILLGRFPPHAVVKGHTSQSSCEHHQDGGLDKK